MNPRPGGDDSQFLSADELAVEADLLSYADRVAPLPSASFVDRVMAAAERSPVPAARGPRAWATELFGVAGRRLRVAVAQVAGGPSISLRVRLQAGVMLVLVALLITAGAALAAAGATSVVTWVAGPQVQATAGHSSASPTLRPNQSGDTTQSSGYPKGSGNPGNGGKPSPNPGNCGKPSQNQGNGNQPSQNPGNCGHSSQNPGNHGQPSQNPGNRPSDHSNASSHPGNGGQPKGPKPTASAHP
jgi:hypothetical protein